MASDSPHRLKATAAFWAPLTVFLAVACLLAPIARADNPPLIGEFGGAMGSGAGQIQDVRAMTADPVSGHVFLTDVGVSAVPNERVDEFTAWGEFVKSWGWGVRNGAAELQTCGPGATPPSTTCEAGVAGGGAGQFDRPRGIALDSVGNVFVFERYNARVQKFTSAGEFLLMFGGEVNKTDGTDICTKTDLEAGDVCGKGVLGTGDSEFSVENVLGVEGNYIDVGPDDTVFVGDRDRIQVFDSDGAFKRSLALPVPGNNPGALAVDPTSGDLYFAYAQRDIAKPDVYRIDPATGSVLQKLPVSVPDALSVDEAGNVFVVDRETPNYIGHSEVIAFTLTGAPLIPSGSEFSLSPLEEPGTGNNFREILAAITTNSVTAAGGVGVYAARMNYKTERTTISFYGAPPDKWPPPLKPPALEAQYASSVGTEDALVRAVINPHFWDDTTFYVEYGTAPCAGGGCTKQPLPPGLSLGGGVVNAGVKSPAVVLSGLQPGTTYHFRFVAQSSGGGPVVGVEGAERTFTTFPTPRSPRTDCPNQAFRIGASAALPDCRAYELVSPLAKNGADIVTQCNGVCYPARLDQAAAGGGRFTFSASASFADQPSTPYSSQYLAERTASGWVTTGLNPPSEGTPSAIDLDSMYAAFSSDLTSGWLVNSTKPLLDPAAMPGYSNLYRRDLGGGGYEALTTSPPSDQTATNFRVRVQGLSADASHVVFRANGKLTEDAAAKGRMQVYEYFEGQLRLVSITPQGKAANEGASAGTSPAAVTREEWVSNNAISEDGSHIFWTDAEGGVGKLYVRIDGTSTRLISNKSARFLTAAADGSRVFYVVPGSEETLYEYDLSTSTETPIADHVIGFAGASEDGSRLYFASTAALAPGATAGEGNLFLHEDGEGISFIGNLAEDDFDGFSTFNPISENPMFHSARVSDDGDVLVFMSQANPTGFENADANSGEPDTEVYRYEASTAQLRCVSCSRSGERPSGQLLKKRSGQVTATWGAAQIPGWEMPLFAPRVLADGGDRIYFESFEPLVLQDTNGARDVYQWEAPGTGDCTEESPHFSELAGGCVDLISSGESPDESEFLDASADGSEVFFTTSSSLVSHDPGLIDVYVARAGGGFPPPQPPPAICEGEACQGPPSPPNDPTPASSSFEGAGNVNGKVAGRRACPKAKHRNNSARRADKGRCHKRVPARANAKHKGGHR